MNFGFGGGLVGISFLNPTSGVPVFLHFGFGISAFQYLFLAIKSLAGRM